MLFMFMCSKDGFFTFFCLSGLFCAQILKVVPLPNELAPNSSYRLSKLFFSENEPEKS